MTQSIDSSKQQGRDRSRDVSSWQWIVGSTAALATACAVAGPDLVSEEDGSPVVGFMAVICIFGSFRAMAGLLEWYLLRQYSLRAIVLSHLVGVGIGVMVGVGPDPTKPAGNTPAIGGIALAVFTYLFVALCGLGLAAAIALCRALRRGGRPPERAPQHDRSLASLPALFWFNSVFVIVVAIMMAPNMAAQENGTLFYGFMGGLVVVVLMRLPGVCAEWWLTKRALHRVVYGVHPVAGLFTALIALTTYISPPSKPSAESYDPVAGTLGVYLLLSSTGMWATVAIVAAVRVSRRRSTGRPANTIPTQPISYSGTAQPAPLAWDPAPSFPLIRGTAQVSPRPATAATRQPPPTVAAPTELIPVPVPVTTPEQPSTDVTDGHGRTNKLRNEIAVAVGIVAGLASLVQGYDSADPLRTVGLALAVGVIGLCVIFGTTTRR